MEPDTNTDTKVQSSLTFPMALVISAIIIGGAIFFSRGGGRIAEVTPTPGPFDTASQLQDIPIRAVSTSDHMLGSPTARVTMVEYSDMECPFCKNFHVKMQTLMDQNAKSGDLAWVYRHFPLDIHPKAPKEAEASECAFQQGGNEVFWKYVQKIYDITPSNNGLDFAKLPEIAGQLGLDVAKFNTCLSSGSQATVVKSDYDDGIKAGVNGTPNTVFILTTPLVASAEKQLRDINRSFLSQSPPGTPDVVVIDSTKTKVQVGGDISLPALKEILRLTLLKS